MSLRLQSPVSDRLHAEGALSRLQGCDDSPALYQGTASEGLASHDDFLSLRVLCASVVNSRPLATIPE